MNAQQDKDFEENSIYKYSPKDSQALRKIPNSSVEESLDF